jgi:pimeloyl-ACP methyl ester carboxylesterase
MPSLDVAIHKGEKNKPAVILIHGLGMDKNIWADTLNTKIFAKSIPVRVFTGVKPKPYTPISLNPPQPPFIKGGNKGGLDKGDMEDFQRETRRITLGEYPENIKSLWAALKDEGYNLICWSQRRPVDPIDIAVEELTGIARKSKRLFPKTPIALIGHSRGGLIARKFMGEKRPEIKALITISTPHAGSSIALLGKYLKPFSAVLKSILPRNTHGTISEIIKNITNLIEGDALKELLPDSAFLKSLRDSPHKGVSYMSLGGTEPRLFTVYVWRRKGRKMYPRAFLSVPVSLLKILPSFLIVDEITLGKGDGLVSAKSSLLPWASEHHNLHVNHLSILWNKKAMDSIIETLRAI